jgi:uncharacterized coiled-coil DUF342 family protein
MAELKSNLVSIPSKFNALSPKQRGVGNLNPFRLIQSGWTSRAALALTFTLISCTPASFVQPNLPKQKSQSPDFSIKSTPFCPIPSSYYPIAYTSTTGGGTYSVHHTLYGSSSEDFGFFDGNIRFRQNADGYIFLEVFVRGQNGFPIGSQYYSLTSTVTLPVKDLDEDFSYSGGNPMTFASTNDYGGTWYEGTGSINVSYTASTGLWTLNVNGQGTVSASSSLYIYPGAGSATYNATAQFETQVCTPPTLEVEVTPEIFSPANEDRKFDGANLHIKSSTGQPWAIKILGKKPGPLDERGLPTAGDTCTWSTSGSGVEEDVPFNGKCNDGTYMLDGLYGVEVTSAGRSAGDTIKIDNTAPIIGDAVLSPTSTNETAYTAELEDPIVNGVASGLDITDLDLIVTDANGTPLNVTGTTLTSLPGTDSSSPYQIAFKGPSINGPILIYANDKVANRNSGQKPSCSVPPTLNELKNLIRDLLRAFREISKAKNKVENLLGRIGSSQDESEQFVSRLMALETQLANMEGGFQVNSLQEDSPKYQETLNEIFNKAREANDYLSGERTSFDEVLSDVNDMRDTLPGELEAERNKMQDLQYDRDNLVQQRDSIRNSNLPRDEKLRLIDDIKNNLNHTNDMIRDSQKVVDRLLKWQDFLTNHTTDLAIKLHIFDEITKGIKDGIQKYLDYYNCKNPGTNPYKDVFVEGIPDSQHRKKLRANLASDGPPCKGNNDTHGFEYEQAHHIVPLRYFDLGMGEVHAILATCGIKIDSSQNGVCLDDATHNQTKTKKEDDSYVKQILEIFRRTKDASGTPNCPKVESNLNAIKGHLLEENRQSQLRTQPGGGREPIIDIGDLGL